MLPDEYLADSAARLAPMIETGYFPPIQAFTSHCHHTSVPASPNGLGEVYPKRRSQCPTPNSPIRRVRVAQKAAISLLKIRSLGGHGAIPATLIVFASRTIPFARWFGAKSPRSNYLPRQSKSRPWPRIGIECRASRNATLAQLAAEVPAADVADMLSVLLTTATKWVKESR